MRLRWVWLFLEQAFHCFELLKTFPTTPTLASRLASISALLYAFVVIDIWACLMSFCCTPHRYSQADLLFARATRCRLPL